MSRRAIDPAHRSWTGVATLSVTLLVAACGGGSGTATPDSVADLDVVTATTGAIEDENDVVATTEPANEGELAPDVSDTAWARFEELAGEQGDTPEVALVEFAVTFGSIDGVDTSAIGPADDSWHPTYTPVVEGVVHHWDAYSDDVRSQVALRFAEYLGLVEPEGFARSGQTVRPALEWDEAVEWLPIARAAEAWLDGQLDVDVDLDYELRLLPGSSGVGASTEPSTGTATESVITDWIDDVLGIDVPSYVGESCVITLRDVEALDDRSRRGAIAHELFHCWSIDFLGVGRHMSTPGWVQEGLATWVGEVYVGGSPYMAGRWPQYLASGADVGQWNLFPSEYTALGFWSTIDSFTGDLFDHIPDVMLAATSDIAAYETVLGLLDGEESASIAAAAANRPSFGSLWQQFGPGAPGYGRGSRTATTLAPGGAPVEWQTGIGGQTNRTLKVGDHDDWVVVDVAVSGGGRLRWVGGPEIVVTAGARNQAFCLDGPCVCPDGSPARDGLEAISSTELVAATTGATVPTDVRIAALTSDDLCAPECPETPGVAAGDASASDVGGGGDGSPTGGSPTAGPADPDCTGELDPCLVGTWLADREQTVVYAARTYLGAGVSPQYNGGELRWVLGADGSFAEIATAIDLSATIEGIEGRQVFDRTLLGTWQIIDRGRVLVTPTSMDTDIRQFVAGIPLPPVSSSLGAADLDPGEFVYTCTDASLVLDVVPVWAPPSAWTRLG
jgi:hypothetical protein